MEAIVFRERKSFLALAQRHLESVSEWLSRLKGAIEKCSFGEHFEEFLVTQFVCGLTAPNLFESICQLSVPCSFEAIVTMAVSFEGKEMKVAVPVEAKDTAISKVEPVPVIAQKQTVAEEAVVKPSPVRKISRFLISPAIEAVPDAELINAETNVQVPDTPDASTPVSDISDSNTTATPASENNSVTNSSPTSILNGPDKEVLESVIPSQTPDADQSNTDSKPPMQRKISRFMVSPSIDVLQQLEKFVPPDEPADHKHLVLPIHSDLLQLQNEQSPSPVRKTSPDRVSAWEQLKIGLENITHAQVQSIAKLKEAAISQSSSKEINEALPGSPKRLHQLLSDNSQKLNSPTETSRISFVRNLQFDGSSGDGDTISQLSECDGLSEPASPMHGTAQKSTFDPPESIIDEQEAKELTSRANLRFFRNSLETSSINLLNSKSNYFDTDTIEMEYPRNLDDNIEILSREAEDLEVLFTASAEEKLAHYVPKDVIIPEIIDDLDADDNDEDGDNEDDPIGMSPCGRFFKYDKEIGYGSFKTVFRGLDTHTGVAVAWCELLVSFPLMLGRNS